MCLCAVVRERATLDEEKRASLYDQMQQTSFAGMTKVFERFDITSHVTALRVDKGINVLSWGVRRCTDTSDRFAMLLTAIHASRAPKVYVFLIRIKNMYS